MYQRSYEIPKFWTMKMSQECKRCLNFISSRVSENAIVVTMEEDNHRLNKEYILTLTDTVWNPIDILIATQREVDSYHDLLYPNFYYEGQPDTPIIASCYIHDCSMIQR